MIRRLVRHGPSTLIVSLPADWVRRKGLKEKDEVEVTEDENQLLVSLKGNKKKDETIVDITDLDRTSVLVTLTAIYRAGFSKATLIFRKQNTTYLRTSEPIQFSKIIHGHMQNFIGFEISKESQDRIEITQVSHIDKEEIGTMINRTLILLKDFTSSFCLALEKHDQEEMSKIPDKRATVTKMLNYLLRAVKRGDYSEKDSSQCLSHTLANIDRLVIMIKCLARDEFPSMKPMSKKTHHLIHLFEECITNYIKLFRKYDDALLVRLTNDRENFRRDVPKLAKTLPAHDLRMLTFMGQGLDLVHDLVEWRIHLHIIDQVRKNDDARQ
jgi:phosphate uptake regulator